MTLLSVTKGGSSGFQLRPSGDDAEGRVRRANDRRDGRPVGQLRDVPRSHPVPGVEALLGNQDSMASELLTATFTRVF